MTLLQGLFRLILSLSLTGSLAALLVLGAKAVTRDRLGTGWNYYIWALPMALYLCPVPLSLNRGQSPPPRTAAVAGGSPAAGAMPAGAAGGGALPAGEPDLLLQLLPVLAWVWLLGVLFAAAVRIAEGRRLRAGLRSCFREPAPEGQALAEFRKALAELGIREGRVRLVICPGVESPLLTGLLRPVVLLPREDQPREQLGMMLRHELYHYRSRDLWFKAAAMGVACLHWFNPLVWGMLRDLDRCCELRCDQRTAGGMEAGERRLYGRLLLDIAREGAAPVGLPLTGGKEELRRRLGLLREGWRTGRWERAASAGIAAVVAVVGVVCAASVYPGPVLTAGPEKQPQAAAPAGEEEIPELWSGGVSGDQGGSGTEPPPQPPLKMQAVLGDQVTGVQPPEEEAPEGDKAEDPGPADGGEPSEETGEPAEDTPVLTPEERQAEARLREIKEQAEYRLTEDEAAALCWGGALLWPVDGGELSCGFSQWAGHTGVDIRANAGTEIYAAADGVVVCAVDYPIWPYGKRVDIDHGDGVLTRYAHCSRVLVEPGEEVRAGQLIALVGRTGNATGNHCHLELRFDGEPQDPMEYISE